MSELKSPFVPGVGGCCEEQVQGCLSWVRVGSGDSLASSHLEQMCPGSSEQGIRGSGMC